jgi:hypothetical protein
LTTKLDKILERNISIFWMAKAERFKKKEAARCSHPDGPRQEETDMRQYF